MCGRGVVAVTLILLVCCTVYAKFAIILYKELFYAWQPFWVDITERVGYITI